MERIDKSIVSMIVFLVIVLFIAVFGFLVIKNNPHKQEKKEPLKVKTNDYQAIKIDPQKDFVTFSNHQVVSEELEIYYSDIEINIANPQALTIAQQLNTKTHDYAQKVTYISQTTVDQEQDITNIDDIYYAPVRTYDYYVDHNYLIIKVHDYEYWATGETTAINDEFYVFNLNDGSQVTNEQLLNYYGISKTTLMRRISESIEAKYKANSSLIKLNETIARLNVPENIALYITKDGHLVANIVVITNDINYNDNIIIE